MSQNKTEGIFYRYVREKGAAMKFLVLPAAIFATSL
jgi:hypothetical protein